MRQTLGQLIAQLQEFSANSPCGDETFVVGQARLHIDDDEENAIVYLEKLEML